MNITRKIVAFACLVSLTGVVGPQLAYGDVLREAEKMVSEAVSLYSRSGPGDVVRAKALFKKAADAGHPLGVMWVARSHFRGRVGFREDRDLAETLAGRV
ncbi:MAG: hypothetical protein OXN89_26090, partial [Bryobacterales bacterium]|nr:hypothetical protein [Bryobacterales bacterium]